MNPKEELYKLSSTVSIHGNILEMNFKINVGNPRHKLPHHLLNRKWVASKKKRKSNKPLV